VKKHLEIIKGFGLFLLLFVLVGTVAASDDIQTVSVTITQTSLAGEDANPVTNTYNKEIESAESIDVHIKGLISGDQASVITNLDDMITNEVDTTIMESAAPVSMPKFIFGESPDKFTEELSLWISYKLDGNSFKIADDFLLDVDKMINV
jgi:hypothetical protein